MHYGCDIHWPRFVREFRGSRRYAREAVILAVVFVISAAPNSAPGAEPTVQNVTPRGLQIGGKTKITFDGAEFGANPRLVFPWPHAKATLLSEGTANRASFDIELPGDVMAGIEQIRLATDGGVTAPLVVAIDRMPQLAFTSPIAAIPAALHGTLAGSAILETQFTATAAGEVTIEVESQRLGGKLRPVLHLLDEHRRQLAWSWPQRPLGGDTRLTCKLPAAGVYRIQLHDLEYATPGPGHFRLKVGDWHRAELVFPPAIATGQVMSIQLLGNFPTDKVELPAADSAESRAVSWPKDSNASGPRPTILVTDLPELVEQPVAATPQELANLPAAVSGRLLIAGEEDRYRVAVSAGSKIRFEVFSERLGTSCDLVLTIQDEKGGVLARGDDAPNTADPMLEYTVPANVTQVTIAISDMLGRGDAAAIYRLVATPVVEPSTERSFTLSTASDRMPLAQGGRAAWPVIVDRRGYEGPVRLQFDGLPAGVAISGTAEIPAGANGCLVSLIGGATPTVGRVTIRGTSEDSAIRRSVLVEQHSLGNLQPWLRADLAAAVTTATALRVEWGDFPADARWILAGKLTAPVLISRPEGEATPVRLTLAVAQYVPRVNNNPDQNRAIRVEKPVELNPDQWAGELVALVPPDLTALSYDVAIVAELLTKDKNSVVAVATTSVKRLAVLNPVGLVLAQPTMDAKLDAKAGAVVKVQGKVERQGGFAGEVTVNAVGPPAGVKADKIVVPAGMDAFEFPLTFPANFKPGDVTGIRLFASGVPDSTKPNQTVRTKDLPITIKLAAAD